MKIYQSFLTGIYKVFKVLLTIVFSVMTITITIQIFGRYLFGKGWAWTDEVARYGNFILVYMGAPLVLFKNDHIFVNALDGFVPQKSIRWLNLVRMLIVTVYTGFMTFYSPVAVKMGMTSVSANTGLPMWIIYLVFPAAFALMFLYALFNTLSYLLDRPLAFEGEVKDETEALLEEMKNFENDEKEDQK